MDAYTIYPLFVSDVIEKINSVYKLTGREEPFKEIGEILKTETLKARNYVTSHKIEQEILELYENWKNNGDKSDGIGGINFILEYFQGVIKDEEIELLSRYISEKS